MQKWAKNRIKEGYEILLYPIKYNAIRNEDEIFYIQNYKEQGYNLLNASLGGDNGGCLPGYEWSEESKQRKSAAMKGKAQKPSQRAAINAALALPEVRAKMRASRAKYTHSKEIYEKIAAKLRGKPRPDHVKKKIGAKHKGKTVSEETRKRQSAAQLKRFERERNTKT